MRLQKCLFPSPSLSLYLSLSLSLSACTFYVSLVGTHIYLHISISNMQNSHIYLPHHINSQFTTTSFCFNFAWLDFGFPILDFPISNIHIIYEISNIKISEISICGWASRASKHEIQGCWRWGRVEFGKKGSLSRTVVIRQRSIWDFRQQKCHKSLLVFPLFVCRLLCELQPTRGRSSKKSVDLVLRTGG